MQQGMNIFVDANVLLGFYALSPADLEELRKLIALIKSKKIVLWMPMQALDECRRNRPKVVADARRVLAEARIGATLPAIASGLPERTTAQDALKTAYTAHAALVAALDEKIATNSLEADLVIAELLALAADLETDSLIQCARDRRDLRRPPGKGTSLGDALNWEALLRDVPDGEDLYLVTEDPDFRSPLHENELHEYVADEWRRRKGAEAILFRSLGALARKHYPSIELASDVPKLEDIQALETSATFAETHSVVARLQRYDLFTPEQAHLLIRAAAENSQVLWIARDGDVFALLKRVIDAHRTVLDPGAVSRLEAEMYPLASSNDGDDEPLF